MIGDIFPKDRSNQVTVKELENREIEQKSVGEDLLYKTGNTKKDVWKYKTMYAISWNIYIE